jgi:hypothetical protein
MFGDLRPRIFTLEYHCRNPYLHVFCRSENCTKSPAILPLRAAVSRRIPPNRNVFSSPQQLLLASSSFSQRPSITFSLPQWTFAESRSVAQAPKPVRPPSFVVIPPALSAFREGNPLARLRRAVRGTCFCFLCHLSAALFAKSKSAAWTPVEFTGGPRRSLRLLSPLVTVWQRVSLNFLDRDTRSKNSN